MGGIKSNNNMKRYKKVVRVLVITTGIILIVWLLLTLWVEAEGPALLTKSGNDKSEQTVLVVYDPDPFYNLDEQVCNAFASVLADSGWKVTLATVAAAKKEECSGFKLFVLCTNTYNWRPDWAITRFVKRYTVLRNKPVVAITLGAGSTAAAQKAFERMILAQGAVIAESRSLWLLRPNDETRTKEKNANVAVDTAKELAKQLAVRLQKG
jgi:hypothetical protein